MCGSLAERLVQYLFNQPLDSFRERRGTKAYSPTNPSGGGGGEGRRPDHSFTMQPASYYPLKDLTCDRATSRTVQAFFDEQLGYSKRSQFCVAGSRCCGLSLDDAGGCRKFRICMRWERLKLTNHAGEDMKTWNNPWILPPPDCLG